MTNLLLKINLALLAGFAVLVFAGGADAILAVTGDKFGGEALKLLLLMTFLMALYSWRQVLDIAAHTVEKNGPLIWAHTVLIVSVLPGVLALPWLGVYALPVSHVAGVIIASFLLIYRLRIAGFPYQMDWPAILKLAAVLTVTLVVVSLARSSLAWPLLMLLGSAVFCALYWLSKPIDDQEKQALEEVVRKRANS